MAADIIQVCQDCQVVLRPLRGQHLVFRSWELEGFAKFKVSKMSKLAGQGVQDAQVDESVDFRGFGSRCPRCPRYFEGPYEASIQELGVRS